MNNKRKLKKKGLSKKNSKLLMDSLEELTELSRKEDKKISKKIEKLEVDKKNENESFNRNVSKEKFKKILKEATPINPKKELRKLEFQSSKKKEAWVDFLSDDYDGDWFYIFRMIRFKTEMMRDHFSRKSVSIDKEVHLKQMSELINLIGKIENDEYFKEEMKPVEVRYGKYIVEILNQTDNLDANSFFVCSYDKLEPKEKGYALRRVSTAHRKSHEKREKDIEKVFIFLKKHMRNWSY